MARAGRKTPTQFAFNSALLLEHQELASHIAVIACKWTELEMRIGTLIAQILGIDALLGLQIYLSVENDGAKGAMLRSIAKDRLTPEELVNLEGILKKIRERRRERNDVIHGSWGISLGRDDGLAWCDPRDTVKQFANITSQVHRDPNARMTLGTSQETRIYRLADFEKIEARFEVLHQEIHEFGNRVATRRGRQSMRPKSGLWPK